MNKYYILVNEWNYPTESGRDVVETFDTLEEAMIFAKKECSNEMFNFSNICEKVEHIDQINDVGYCGYIMTASLNPYYFLSRIIECTKFEA